MGITVKIKGSNKPKVGTKRYGYRALIYTDITFHGLKPQLWKLKEGNKTLSTFKEERPVITFPINSANKTLKLSVKVDGKWYSKIIKPIKSIELFGNRTPLVGLEYNYILKNTKDPVEYWELIKGNQVQMRVAAPIFKTKFSKSHVGEKMKLRAKINGKWYSQYLKIRDAKPEIISVKWQDNHFNDIYNYDVMGYSDTVYLVVQTKDIPPQEITIYIYEDENRDGHSQNTSRFLKQYKKKIKVKSNGEGLAKFKITDLANFRKNLNIIDFNDEKVHEYYPMVSYNEMNEMHDTTFLKVSNISYKKAQAPTNYTPVVIDSKSKSKKNNKKEGVKTIDFTIGMFFDGTLNNMYNTELRQYIKTGKMPKEAKELKEIVNKGITKKEAHKNLKKEGAEIFDKHGDTDNEFAETSYQNDLSNPAILFKKYKEDSKNNTFKLYIEGIGTNTLKKEKKFNLESYDADARMGKAFGKGDTGIKNRVRKGIEEAAALIEEKCKDGSKVGKITFDVFGFSRGAAAARHFTYIVLSDSYFYYRLEDKFGYLLDPKYIDTLMPPYGYLGQLLQEEELMSTGTKIEIRFAGLYDTVPHEGWYQKSDVEDLGLNDISKANYVVHMTAADEHRRHFDLVDISTVTKVTPESGIQGGIELSFPGVHSDVGGGYNDHTTEIVHRIDAWKSYEDLDKIRKNLIDEKWFNEKQLTIKKSLTVIQPPGFFNTYYNRLEGQRFLSNQYSFIALHFMAKFCEMKKVPIDVKDVEKFKNFKNKTGHVKIIDKDTGKVKRVKRIFRHKAFLKAIKKKMERYSFYGEELQLTSEEIAKLRNNYFHWNAIYGHHDPTDRTADAYKPNFNEKGERERNVH